MGGSFIPHHSASDQHSWALETLPGVTFSRTDFHCSGNKTLVLFMVTQKHGKTWKIQKKANQASMSTETTAFPWGKNSHPHSGIALQEFFGVFSLSVLIYLYKYRKQ